MLALGMLDIMVTFKVGADLDKTQLTFGKGTGSP